MMKEISSQTILGILGSGQLARMTALAAHTLGIETHIYCSESQTSPAQQVATKTFKGALNDLNALLGFCQDCDVVTLENEFIDQKILNAIDQKFPDKLFPHSGSFALIGDKITEKLTFQQAGINVVPFSKVNTKEDVIAFAKSYGFPLVLKSAKGGYDGYGNITLKNESDLSDHFTKLKGELLVEAFIPYERELAIMVARNKKGEMVFYPVAHTIQENHICHFVSVPADITTDIEQQIIDQSKKAMLAIDAIGIFAFEFFLTKENQLYLNESAPRPHNSGHYSIEGCETSQFENHVRSVLNLPLGKTTLRSPKVLMLNLLGTSSGPAELKPMENFLSVKDGYLHLYGKQESRPGRKMGHYTLLGNDSKKMMATLSKLKAEYTL